VIHIDIIDGVPGSAYTQSVPHFLPAFQRYADAVRLAWSLDAVTLHFAPTVRAADPDHWWLVCNNRSDVPNAGGYHDLQPSGLPYSRVFAGDAYREGFSLTVDLTHELAEMLVDPTLDREWFDGAGKTYLIEVGDPVEDDLYALDIDGVKCSDFVLPSYYRHWTGPATFDAAGHLTEPCPRLLSGGYISFLENGQWQQKFARLDNGAQSRRSQRYGRAARRATR
jgi:hypothetical protein